MLSKKELRQQIKLAKQQLSASEKSLRSEVIMARVELLQPFIDANTVLLYWSMADEVQTQAFVNRWYQRKQLLLPCVDGDDLLLRQYTGTDSMVAGPLFGIGEPTGPLFTDVDKIDLIIVPGVAFDRHCNRMGRGRGYYDRLLRTTERAAKVGIAYDCQLIDSVPTEAHDVAMDIVVSESETIINQH